MPLTMDFSPGMHLIIKRAFFSSFKSTEMNTESILRSDVLDIIFEHRNKAYGAYTLRKFYNNRLYKALGAVFTLILVLFLVNYFMPQKKNVLSTVPYIMDPGLKSPIKHDPVKPKDPQQPQKPVASKRSPCKLSQIIFRSCRTDSLHL